MKFISLKLYLLVSIGLFGFIYKSHSQCNPVTTVNVDSINFSFANLSWSTPSGDPPVGYVLEYKEVAVPGWTSGITTDPWINEIHYRNTGTDEDEGIEVAGVDGTNLSCYTAHLMRVNSGVCFYIDSLQLFGFIDDEINNFGALWFDWPGLPDSKSGIVLEYNANSCDCPGEKRSVNPVSYRPNFNACGGGVHPSTVFKDIVQREPLANPLGFSLQLSGTGSHYNDFTWNAPTIASRGSLNPNQIPINVLEDGFSLMATIPSLKPCTKYKFRVRTVCTSVSSTVTNSSDVFTTNQIDAGNVMFVGGDLALCEGQNGAIDITSSNLLFDQNYCQFLYGFALVDSSNDSILNIDTGHMLDDGISPTSNLPLVGLTEGIYEVHGFSYPDPGSISPSATFLYNLDAGCVSFSEQPLMISVGLPLSDTLSKNITCNGFANGRIRIIPVSTPPFNYTWNPVLPNSGTQSDLSPGTYDVTIVDGIGCTKELTFSITEPDLLSSTAQTTPISCVGGSNGTGTATTTGGTPPYFYEWQQPAGTPIGQNTSTATGLLLGTYVCSIVDANSCVTTVTTNVTEIPLFEIQNISSTPPTCPDDSNAIATVSYTGGTSPVTFNWSNGESTQTATMLSGGIVTVTITDVNGCTDTTNETIFNIPTLTVNVILNNNISCYSGSDGSATALVSGANTALGYTLLWDNGETTNSAIQLNAGFYILTATDINGCIGTGSINITEPDLLEIKLDLATNISCFGENVGALEISGTGGTPPYSYIWDDNQTGTSPIGLPAGPHVVTITDANNCETTDLFTLTQPDLLSILTNPIVEDVSCNGNNDGSIQIIVSGGEQPYTYLWSNSETTVTINNLSVGSYDVSVTDTNSCVDIASITITEPDVLIAVATQDAGVLCNGDSNGKGTISTSGGIMPYSYLWESGELTPSAIALHGGSNQYTVTDANGCFYLSDVSIDEPLTLDLTSSIQTTTVSCFGGNNGTATLTPTDGTSPYVVNWSDGQLGNTAVNLIAGTYSVTVTDANNCTLVDDVTVSQINEITPNISTDSVSCFGGNDGVAFVAPSGGSPPFQYLWDSNAQNQTTVAVTGLVAGNYSLTITDDLGCVQFANTVVGQPGALELITMALPQELCEGFSSELSVTVTGGVEPFNYDWGTSQQQTILVSPLMDTSFAITVTDANNCSTTTSQLVEVYEIPNLINIEDSVILVLADTVDSEFEVSLDNYFTPEGEYDWELTYLDDVFTNQSNFSGTTSNIITEKLYLRFPSLDRSGIAEYTVYPYIVTPGGNSCYGGEIIIRVQVNPFIPPYVDVEITEILTPNGDGKNDQLDIYVNDETVTNYIVNVYNRSGAIVFTGDENSDSWDGTVENAGNLVPDGSYWIVVERNDKIIYRSAVTVINSSN